MMHKLTKITTLCAIIFLISSCIASRHAVERHQQLKMCRSACTVTFNHCSSLCNDNCKRCTISANAIAAKRFKQYKYQQHLQGEIVALELFSFRDPLQCRKVTCSCKADYNVCIQYCKGKISKRLQVVPPC